MGRTNPSIQIPEAQGLTWRDSFFEQETDVIAVFDFEYEKIEKFHGDVGCVSLLVCPPILVLSSFCCTPCLFKQQIAWNTYAQHVCVTRDGIKYVIDKRKSGFGFSFEDQGKTSKTVPFDKITDCDVTEPAGATCFCIPNVLTAFHVDTASVSQGEGGPQHELALSGLEKPLELKKLIWAMKRAQTQGVTVAAAVSPKESAAPTTATMIDRGDDAAETNQILRDIRTELQELNRNLTAK